MKPIDPRKGIIVSYPHSGLNWVRYCIETLSGLRTAGSPRVVAEGELAVYRTHNVNNRSGPNSTDCAFFNEEGRPIHQRVVLLLRDYRESFLRLARAKPWYELSADRIKRGRVFNFRNYFDNLKAYDRFAGKKLLIRYHEVVIDLEKVRTILDFLDLPCDIRGFDIDHHRERSLKLFNGQHVSYTKSDLTNFSWHQKDVDGDVLAALDEFVMHKYPKLMARYFPNGSGVAHAHI